MTSQRQPLVPVIFRAFVVLVILGVAGAIYSWMVATAPKPAVSDLSADPPRVQVIQAQPVPVRRQWEGFGTAVAMDSANVPARVTATVVERPENVRPGQAVRQGQLLIRLDDSDFTRQVEIASQALKDLEAQLLRLDVEEQSWTKRAELATNAVRLAQAEYERIRQAFQSDVAKQREVDLAQRALYNAQEGEVAAREELDKISPRRASLKAQREREQATLRLASTNVERSRIVSPLDGVLQSVDVEVGENIAAGQRVARVVSLDRIEVPLLLPAAARADVALGDEVQLNDAGASSNLWSARVTRIAPEDDDATRTMTVYVEVQRQVSGAGGQGPGTAPPPGKFVHGVVIAGAPQSRWVVPRRSVDGQRLMLIEAGLIKSRTVEVDFTMSAEFPSLGLPDRQWVVLKHRLPDDALVVVDSSRPLAEGSAVTAVRASGQAVGANAILPAPGVTTEDNQ